MPQLRGCKPQQLLGLAVEVLRVLGGGLRSVAPVIGILLVFQLVVRRQPLETCREVAIAGSSSSSSALRWA